MGGGPGVHLLMLTAWASSTSHSCWASPPGMEHSTVEANFHTGKGVCFLALERVHPVEAETLKSRASDLALPPHPHLIAGLLSSFFFFLPVSEISSSSMVAFPFKACHRMTSPDLQWWQWTDLMLQICFHCTVCYWIFTCLGSPEIVHFEPQRRLWRWSHLQYYLFYFHCCNSSN